MGIIPQCKHGGGSCPIPSTSYNGRWWIMPNPVYEQQWEVRVAYKKGWEVRMAYYDRLLRSVMEMIEGTVKIMKVDGMSEAVEDLGKALLAIEDAWATLAVEKSSALVAREREPRGIEGNMQAGE
jgi:hypothetical protein